MSEEKISAPAAHWRRRTRTNPIPKDQAVRQGDITSLAFLSLGKDGAIAFLNTEHAGLGGRPLDVAMASKAGEEKVQLMLKDRADGRSGGRDGAP